MLYLMYTHTSASATTKPILKRKITRLRMQVKIDLLSEISFFFPAN